MKSQGTTKIIRIYPLVTFDAKFHGRPSNSCPDISLWTSCWTKLPTDISIHGAMLLICPIK